MRHPPEPKLEIPRAIQIVARGKWRLLILEQLLEEPRRLSELKRLLPQASKKMILESLQCLIAAGWVERMDIGGRTKHVEYHLCPHAEISIRSLIAVFVKQNAP